MWEDTRRSSKSYLRWKVQGLIELLRELFLCEAPVAKKAVDYGRAFNHPEHLVFFYGVDGTLEALQHFEELLKEKPGKTSLRKKWDGAPQIYWGREKKNGPLILAGHNGWARGAKSTNPEEVFNFIATQRTYIREYLFKLYFHLS